MHNYLLLLAEATEFADCVNGDLRLIGGQAKNEGSVQICYNNAWTYLCSGWWWGSTEANVVCGQLGFLSYGIYKKLCKKLLTWIPQGLWHIHTIILMHLRIHHLSMDFFIVMALQKNS